MIDPSQRLQNLPKAVLPPLSPVPPGFKGAGPPKNPFAITHQERAILEESIKPPFWVEKTLMDDGATSAVIVHPGFVYDQQTPTGEPLGVFFPSGIRDGSGDPVKHAIGIGQAVYVKAHSLELGQVATNQPPGEGEGPVNPVAIVVDVDGKASLRYQPATGSAPEQEGVRYFQLAKCVAGANGDLGLELVLAGSHLCHLRAVGQNLDFKIFTMSETSGGTWTIETEPWRVLCFRDGALVQVTSGLEDRPPADGPMLPDVNTTRTVPYGWSAPP